MTAAATIVRTVGGSRFSAAAIVLLRLRVLRLLRDAADLTSGNDPAPFDARPRLHAGAGGPVTHGYGVEVGVAMLFQRAACGIDVRGAGFQLPLPLQLLVDALQGTRERLLALQGLLNVAREALPSGFALSPGLALLLPDLGAHLAAFRAKLALQVAQAFGVHGINGRMVRAVDELQLALAQYAAFRRAR